MHGSIVVGGAGLETKHIARVQLPVAALTGSGHGQAAHTTVTSASEVTTAWRYRN